MPPGRLPDPARFVVARRGLRLAPHPAAIPYAVPSSSAIRIAWTSSGRISWTRPSSITVMNHALPPVRASNPLVEEFITGRRTIPEKYDESAEPEGFWNRATCYEVLEGAWKAHPSAVEWLRRQGRGT